MLLLLCFQRVQLSLLSIDLSLLRLDLDAELLLKLRSVARLDGLPIDARSVTDEIAAMEEK